MPGRGRGAALQKAIAEAKLKEDPGPLAADVQILEPVKSEPILEPVKSEPILDPIKPEPSVELAKDIANVLDIKEKQANSVSSFHFLRF